MKKWTVLILAAFWLVKWGEGNPNKISMDDNGAMSYSKLTMRQREFNTKDDAQRFVEKKKKDPKNKDFKLYRVEERQL